MVRENSSDSFTEKIVYLTSGEYDQIKIMEDAGDERYINSFLEGLLRDKRKNNKFKLLVK